LSPTCRGPRGLHAATPSCSGTRCAPNRVHRNMGGCGSKLSDDTAAERYKARCCPCPASSAAPKLVTSQPAEPTCITIVAGAVAAARAGGWPWGQHPCRPRLHHHCKWLSAYCFSIWKHCARKGNWWCFCISFMRSCSALSWPVTVNMLATAGQCGAWTGRGARVFARPCLGRHTAPPHRGGPGPAG
jgi:hypothetical protein